jgi:hypothetical protein
MNFDRESDKKTVDYYMNTSFPFDLDLFEDLKKEISCSSTLIIAGFHPHKSIIDMMIKPVHIICFEGTWYGNNNDDDCKNSIVQEMHSDMNNIASIKYYKKKYIYENFSDLKTLEDNPKKIINIYLFNAIDSKSFTVYN